MRQTMLTCSVCSLGPRYLSQTWVLDICCYCVHLANFILNLPLLRIAGSIVGLILLINARSLPLVWHSKATIMTDCRNALIVFVVIVILPLGIARYKYHILSFRHILLLRPSATRHRAVVTQLESRCPVGANPFKFTVTSTSWASESRSGAGGYRAHCFVDLLKAVKVPTKLIGSDTSATLLMQRYDHATA